VCFSPILSSFPVRRSGVYPDHEDAERVGKVPMIFLIGSAISSPASEWPGSGRLGQAGILEEVDHLDPVPARKCSSQIVFRFAKAASDLLVCRPRRDEVRTPLPPRLPQPSPHRRSLSGLPRPESSSPLEMEGFFAFPPAGPDRLAGPSKRAACLPGRLLPVCLRPEIFLEIIRFRQEPGLDGGDLRVFSRRFSSNSRSSGRSPRALALFLHLCRSMAIRADPSGLARRDWHVQKIDPAVGEQEFRSGWNGPFRAT